MGFTSLICLLGLTKSQCKVCTSNDRDLSSFLCIRYCPSYPMSSEEVLFSICISVRNEDDDETSDPNSAVVSGRDL